MRAKWLFEIYRDGDAYWIHLTQNGTQWWGLVDTIMKLLLLQKAGNFSTS